MKFSKIRKFVLINTIIIFLLLLAFYFDNQVIYLIGMIRNSILTDFFMGITFVSSILIIFVFLTILFIRERRRRWILPLWATLVIDIIVGFLLKIVIQRQRPFELGFITLIDGLQKASYYVWNFSFPSFQTMMIFSAIPFLDKEFPKFKYVWVTFACVVALSRVYLGVHFASDVIAGALLGYAIGFFIAKTAERKFWKREI